MASDETFVQSCCERLQIGFATRGETLKELAALFMDLLTRKPIDASHMKRLLFDSYAQYLYFIARGGIHSGLSVF